MTDSLTPRSPVWRLFVVLLAGLAALTAVAGCSASDIRDTTAREVERINERLDAADAALVFAEAVAADGDDTPIASMPSFIRAWAGGILPEAGTIGEVRAHLESNRDAVVAERDAALAQLATIDDNDSGWSAGLTAAGAVLNTIAPLFGPEGAFVLAIGGVATWLGRRVGIKKGAQLVASNFEVAKAGSSSLRAEIGSGATHDVLKTGLAAMPKAVRDGVASVKTKVVSA